MCIFPFEGNRVAELVIRSRPCNVWRLLRDLIPTGAFDQGERRQVTLSLSAQNTAVKRNRGAAITEGKQGAGAFR
jgi:hypothetical protein